MCVSFPGYANWVFRTTRETCTRGGIPFAQPRKLAKIGVPAFAQPRKLATSGRNVAHREPAARALDGAPPLVCPPETVIGALQRYISAPNEDFQPMNANFGILPPLDAPVKNKTERKAAYFARGTAAMRAFADQYGL